MHALKMRTYCVQQVKTSKWTNNEMSNCVEIKHQYTSKYGRTTKTKIVNILGDI